MNIIGFTKRIFLLVVVSVGAPGAFGAGSEITTLNAAADGETVRIEIGLTSPVKPTVHMAGQMGLLVLDFPNVALQAQSRRIVINQAGVSEVHAAVHSAVPLDTWIVVRIDSARPIGLETAGNKLVLRILPHSGQSSAASEKRAVESPDNLHANPNVADAITGKQRAPFTGAPAPEIERIVLPAGIEESPDDDSMATARRRFKIKFIAGNTAYIDGGSNAGLRVGMNIDIRDGEGNPQAAADKQTPVGAARIVGVATTSAILEVGRSNGELKVGDWADLLPQDADNASKNVIAGPANILRPSARPLDVDVDDVAHDMRHSFRPAPARDDETGARTAGRVGLDYSGISSTGSTP